MALNDKDSFRTPIYDPSETLAHTAMDLALYFSSKSFATEQFQTANDLAEGHGSQWDKDKLVGSFTGLTICQDQSQAGRCHLGGIDTWHVVAPSVLWRGPEPGAMRLGDNPQCAWKHARPGRGVFRVDA